MSSADGLVVLLRFLQYVAVSAVGGGAIFAWYAQAPRRFAPFVRGAAVLGGLAAVGWLLAQAAAMGETPAAALDPALVWSVATDTGFGRAALLRAGLLAAAAIAPTRIAGLLGLGAAATFAWTGHGATDEGWAGVAHQAADILHVIAAAVWIGALMALTGLVLQRTSVRRLAQALQAFSRIGVWVVAVIVVSGLANSAFLVGLDDVGQLPAGLYGQLLILKLVLFLSMLALAAFNRWRLTPRLATSGERPALVPVLTETLLAAAVLAIVAWMGTLPPPIHSA